MSIWRENLLNALSPTQDINQVFDVITHAAQDLGFEYCAFGLRLPLPLSNPKVVLLNNYQQQWRDRYEQAQYMTVDPTVAHGMVSIRAMTWDEIDYKNQADFWEEAASFGLVTGWSQSCYGPTGIGGLLTLARSGEPITETELDAKSGQLNLLNQVSFEHLSRIYMENYLPETRVGLTPKEREVLRWTADGKTSGQIAEIMRIAERTVNFHVNNLLTKLNAANKTAAVIKAVMLRLI